MTVLVVIEHDHVGLKSASLHTVTAALACSEAGVDVLVTGSDTDAVAALAAQLDGVGKVLLSDSPMLRDQLAEDVALQVEAIAGSYTHVLFPATAFGKNVAPRVAALLDVAQISDVTGIVSTDTFTRPMYAGNVIATVQSLDALKVLTVRATSFPAVGLGGQAAIEALPIVNGVGKTALIDRASVKSDRPELADAKVVVSGGRALASAEKFGAVLMPLAEKLNAALGASRAAVDAGYASNDSQVGQTGKIVAPDLYIAVGISGAIQHLAGMKDSKVIVAVNKDPEAPIFTIADYGLEADLFTAIPELTEALDSSGHEKT